MNIHPQKKQYQNEQHNEKRNAPKQPPAKANDADEAEDTRRADHAARKAEGKPK